MFLYQDFISTSFLDLSRYIYKYKTIYRDISHIMHPLNSKSNFKFKKLLLEIRLKLTYLCLYPCEYVTHLIFGISKRVEIVRS